MQLLWNPRNAALLSRLNRKSFYRTSTSYFCTSKQQFIAIPDIMDSKSGLVEKWFKKEGEAFEAGASLCEVSLSPSDLMVAVDAKTSGILAKIIHNVGKTVPVGEAIAIFVNTKDDYFEYLDESRMEDLDSSRTAAVQDVIGTALGKPDARVLLRAIKTMIQDGHLEEGSDFAKKLLSLARKGNPDLVASFEASFDGTTHDFSGFDVDFFLENARDIVKEVDEAHR